MFDKIIVGLGNPGPKYKKTRHNIGFIVIEHLAETYQLKFHLGKKSFKSETASGTIDHSKVLLVKPLTYMNKSGEAVAAILNFYKNKPEDILVIHDDLDLPLGRIRIVKGGGAGGHNGIRSIITHLGTQNFPRLRIGIGRPHNETPVENYVLSPFSKEEWSLLEKIIETSTEAIVTILKKGIDMAMNQFNGRVIEI